MLTPLARRVISRIRCLNRSRDFGAILRLISGPPVKLNPRNFRSCGRATALLASFKAAARAYGAVCTPDFFGYDAAHKLKYRGRLDEGRMNAPPAGARKELVEAMRAIASTGTAPAPQFASMGCSIKWKAA